ncbi:unnamed protein product [Oppiella nova]|uniref:Uncharacterized protein n=1 Tax=Oppiella nova TaxID=334625 RepID=A0A7R9LP47_9ACAR|nr:unnamed protein product [Oppiella nova]CAG2165588.1 unnamed protein product [Oppiella nova]
MMASFFDNLRSGVQHIETEVKRLKQMTDNSYQRSEEQVMADLMKAKQFDSNVEVTQLYNEVKGADRPLSDVQNKMEALKQILHDVEDNSGLQRYGYKPFGERYSEAVDDNVFVDDDNSTQWAANCASDESNDENVMNSKSLSQPSHGFSDERTTQTVRLAANAVAVDDKRVDSSDHYADRPITQRYDKLLTRTPQPLDFGITRRFTLMPQLYQQNKSNAKNVTEKASTAVVEPSYDSTQTSRFNYLNLGSAVNPMTPPVNASTNSYNNNNNADSFVTVEFTPGLTTKRPKGVSRVQANHNHLPVNENKRSNGGPTGSGVGQRLPQSVLQSMENDKITPEQPIPVTNTDKSVKILRSIAGKGSGTPPPPKPRVNPNYHNQILKNL